MLPYEKSTTCLFSCSVRTARPPARKQWLFLLYRPITPAAVSRPTARKEKRMKTTHFLSLSLALVISLAGCAPAQDSTAAGTSFTSLQQSSGWNYGGMGPDGFYFVSPDCREDGSTNLMYLDYATMQQVYLCSQPNCSHDTDACTSHLPYSAGGILASVVGEQLDLVFPGNLQTSAGSGTESVLPHIETMGLDGSNRKTTVTLGANQVLSRPLVTDGTFLYTRLDTTAEDGSFTAQLVRIDPAGGEPEVLCPLNQEWLKGGAGARLILWDAEQTYVGYDPATGERTDLYQAEDALIHSNLFGSTLAYLQGGVFHLMDLTTGEDKTLGGYQAKEADGTNISILDADKDHLIFHLESAGSSDYYMLTADQTPQPWGLLYSSGDTEMPYSRVTTVGTDQYLVIAGEDVPQTSELENSPYAVTGERQYVLMPREEYWNGTAPK